jgi:hypothetical protein
MKRNAALASLFVFAACASRPSKPSPSASETRSSAPHAISLSDVAPGGELLTRIELSAHRLEDDQFSPTRTFTEGAEWPGDIPGRTILALTMLSEVTHRDAKNLGAILDQLGPHMNARGYLGPIENEGVVNEQALSGHSWLLRALVEHYLWKHDPRDRALVEGIVRSLLLPTRGYYAQYPILPEQRSKGGKEAGELVGGTVSGWRLSTDVGCAFLMLDGATHAYALLRWPELGALVDEMIARFFEMDVQKVGAQTHATLSALRGIVRYAELTGRLDLVARARQIYSLYRTLAMTAHYANYNWFGRPEWTESCAVIDSVDLAMSLWRLTGETSYIDDAQRIYYNAMARGQRPNGGFGCDTCPGAHGETELASSRAFEAPWCCTMRGGDGLSRAASYGFYQRGNDIDLPFFSEATATVRFPDGSETVLRETTGYPYEGSVRIEIARSTSQAPRSVHLYVPPWGRDKLALRIDDSPRDAPVSRGFVDVVLPGGQGHSVTMTFALSARAVVPPGEAGRLALHSFEHGPLLLGARGVAGIKVARDAALVPKAHATYMIPGTTIEMYPIGGLTFEAESDARAERVQILFED